MENQSRLGWAGSDPESSAWGEADEIPALCSLAPWGSSFVESFRGCSRDTWRDEGALESCGGLKPPPAHTWQRLGHAGGAELGLNISYRLQTPWL